MSEIEKLRAENDRLGRWIDDLHSGIYINCVYCGHRYGPADRTAPTMAETLKLHIAACPKHPMARLVTIAKANRHALISVLATRDGITNEVLSSLLWETENALVDAGVDPGANPFPREGPPVK